MKLRGLYVITDASLGERLLSAAAAALRAGACALQYRDKSSSSTQRRQQALALGDLCRRHGAWFIVNDDAALAAAVGAHGVHLGEHDGSLRQARAVLGEDAIIGISCYNSLSRALTAQAEGADYVAFGRFFPSQSKPQARQAEPALLREAKTRLNLPIVAIGGITASNAAVLIQAGADALAVINDVFASADVETACRAYAPLFQAEDKKEVTR